MKKNWLLPMLSVGVLMMIATQARAVSTTIVLSQIYGGGGNSGSTWKNDFIELHNRGNCAVSLTGWSVQYASSTGAFGVSGNQTNLSGSIPAGGYFLIQEAVGAGGTTSLPTPDVTGSIAMGATGAKVALVSSTTALTGNCPSDPSIVDFIGYGTTADCFEGAGRAPAPSNTTSDVRGNSGCTDTDNNNTDYSVSGVPPTPRNSMTAAFTCGLPDLSVSNPSQSEVTTPMNFTVTLSAASANQVTVHYQTVDGTATTANLDYASASGDLTYSPGQTGKTVAVTINNDATFESNETFTLVLSSPTNATICGSPGTGTIQNDDGLPSVSISGPGKVVEGNSGTTDVTYFIATSNASSSPFSVLVSTADGTATTGNNDYQALSTTVMFGAKDMTSKTVIVKVNGDLKQEPNETFTVNLSNPSGCTIGGAGSVATTISDDGDPVPTVQVTDQKALESVGNMIFPVTLSNSSSNTIVVNYSTSDGTATVANNDYTPVSAAVTFLPKEVGPKNISVPINDDNKFESSESFFLNLSSSNATVSPPGFVTGTINDNDTQPSVSIGDQKVNEGDAGLTKVTFIVTLSNPTAQTVSVPFQTMDGTATVANNDYLPNSGIVVFQPKQTSATISVNVVGDTTPELPEDFFVNLGTPVNATPGDMTAECVINNDDGSLYLIGDASAPEGNAGKTLLNFKVSLFPPLGTLETIQYFTQDGSATVGNNDYQTTAGTLTFQPGETTKTITVSVNGDPFIEDDETFFVKLQNGTGALIGDDTGKGTIQNDDFPSLSISDAKVVEGNSGKTPMVFTVTLSSTTPQQVTVGFATSDGTAKVSNNDYQPATGTLTIPPNTASGTITVMVNGDVTTESAEDMTVQLSNPTKATIADGVGIGIINNDDGLPSLSISDFSQLEGQSGKTIFTFFVSISNPSDVPVTVDFATADGSATLTNNDYQQTSGTVTFAPKSTVSQPVTVSVNGDNKFEVDESFFVNLSNPVNATINDGQGQGTIRNDDTAPVIAIGNASKVEGNSGTSVMTFNLSLSTPSELPVSVFYATQDGSATVANNDYVPVVSGTVTFPSKVTSATASVTINGDVTNEANETFFVNIGNPTNATIGSSNKGTGTITNDDVVPQISITDVTKLEGNSGTQNYVFVVTLSNPTSSAVTVVFTTADGTAKAANNDYVPNTGTLTIPAKQTSRTVTVVVNGDATFENDETFAVNLTSPTAATILDGQGIGTIQNDDVVPSVKINNLAKVEGNSGKTLVTFTVTLSNLTDRQVTVNYTTQDASATVANNDYQPTSGTLTIPPKGPSVGVAVAINGDTFNEPNETFRVALSSPVNASLGIPSVGNCTILNDDGTPQILIDDVKVTEGNSGKTLAQVVLSLTNGSNQPITVDYSTADGSATVADNDYQPQTGTVTWPAKDAASKTVVISVNGDLKNEPDESFFVNLVNAVNANIADNQATVTINTDDDVVPPVIVVKTPNGGENFIVGSPAKIAWNTTDTNPCTVDILLARDGVNYNEVIVLGTPDDGSFVWTVTGPGTNTTATPVFTAKIKVIAHDCAGNTGEDTSDNGFSIFDFATASLLSVFEAHPFDEGGVELRWQLAADAQVTDLGLERGDGASGPWAAVAVESRVEGGVTMAVDRSAEYGKSYFYRLSGTLRSGEKVVLGTLSSKAGERITEFALKRVFPNPTQGMLRIEYAVPRESKVALRVVDVAGRLVANLVDGVVRPGRYQAVWNGRGADGSRVGAGMYFVQLKAPGKNLVHRVAVAQ